MTRIIYPSMYALGVNNIGQTLIAGINRWFAIVDKTYLQIVYM